MALKMGKNPRVELRDPSQAGEVSRHGRAAFLHRLGRAHPRRLVGQQGRRDARPGRGQGQAGRRSASPPRSRATTLERSRRSPRGAPRAVHAARHHGRRRLCLAEGPRLAEGAARSVAAAARHPRLSRGGEPLRRGDPRRRPTRCRSSWSPRCAAASRRTIPACRCRTGRSPIPGSIREGGQHEQIGRTPRDGGDFQTVLDGDALAKASDYFKFGGRRHSPDHRLEAWSADLRGSEYFTIRVRRWDTGEDLPDTSTQTGGSVVWGRDSTFFFYVQRRRESPAAEGLPPSPGHAAEPTTCWSTRRRTPAGSPISRKAPAAASASSPAAITTPRSSGWSISSMPDATPRLIAPREKGVRYSVDDRGDELFILTNADDAIDFRIATAPLATPDRAHWRELIPHRPGVYILSHRALRRPSGAAGAGERAALDRDPRSRDGRRARHRLRRGGLFARHAAAATNSTPRPCASPIRR